MTKLITSNQKPTHHNETAIACLRKHNSISHLFCHQNYISKLLLCCNNIVSNDSRERAEIVFTGCTETH